MVPIRFYLSAALTAALSTAAAAEPLGLDEAQRLAVLGQPQLEAQTAAIQAAREKTVSATQLPDPVLLGGLSDLTLSGPDRYTLHQESAQFTLGLRQAFPGGNKRELRGTRARFEAARLGAELADQQRTVAREAGLAWIAVWKALRNQDLVRAALEESEHQLDASEIVYRAGGASQADLLTARVELELIADRLAGLEQQERQARNQLRRWLPDQADRPLATTLPAFAAPELSRLIEELARHPHLAAQAQAVAVADADLDLARAGKRSDWSAQLAYGYRPDFADYASLSVEVGLPVFTHDRQDRDIAANLAMREQAEQQRQDWLRQHRAELQLNLEDWARLQQRLARYDDVILPQGQARVDAALAAYGAGSGRLESVLAARRALLDLAMQRLELQSDAANRQVALRYFDHRNTDAEKLP